MLKVYANSFAVAYNNKVYALFSSRRLRKDLSLYDQKTLSSQLNKMM